MNFIQKRLSGMGFLLLGLSVRGQDAAGSILQQIAALKGYLATAKEGEQIVENGLTGIRDIRAAEFKLHSIFFDSLALVNPRIKNMNEIANIVGAHQIALDYYLKSERRWLPPRLSEEEFSWLRRVYQQQMILASDNIRMLTVLIEDREYVISDGERIRMISAAEESFKQQTDILFQLITTTDLVVNNRVRESEYIEILKKILASYQ